MARVGRGDGGLADHVDAAHEPAGLVSNAGGLVSIVGKHRDDSLSALRNQRLGRVDINIIDMMGGGLVIELD